MRPARAAPSGSCSRPSIVCGLSTNGLIQTHWVSLCGDYGIAPVAAAGALAVIGAFDFVGTILSGWLSDRYDNRWLLFMYYGLRGLSLIALPFTNFTVIGLSAFAVFYGLDWVATVPPTVRLTAERFGAERANLTFGWIFTAHQLGAATAAFGAGFSRSDFATYLPALYVAGVACVIAAGLVLTIGRRPKEALARGVSARRHREERSDAAIQELRALYVPWIASHTLAMTARFERPILN